MSKRAFTLIELLIVVAIIAILAAIAVPNFLEAQTRAKISRCRADMRSVVTAIEAYYIDNNKYPPMSDRTPTSTWSVFQDIGTGGDDHSRTPSYLTTPVSYITSLPNDPFIPSTTLTGAAYVREIGKRYAYFNYKQYVDTPAFNTVSLNSRYRDAGQWLMYGYGPDMDPFNKQGAVYVNYDPTNGTVSWGNVFRTQRTTDSYQRLQ
jgi:prepilin-type N-terminal cleavage/methylation domain-containing protein